jgi:uncharacterized protein YdeI (YjbR/CyaY-like superfamily)
MPGGRSDLPELIVADAAAFAAWLREHHANSAGVWLVLAKKGTTEPTALRYEEALEEALAQGWIDGQVSSRDDGTYRQRFTRRRPRSIWSKRNTEIAAGLVAEGRMQPAGLAEIERAKADGRWEAAYAGPARMEVPPELVAALAAHPDAQRVFDSLSARNRYAILFRISTARRPETKARRIEQFVTMLERGETIYPQQ